mgnify:FL=1
MQRTTSDEIEKMSQDYKGYIKVVVDVEKHVFAGGGERHFDAEQLLLEGGSKQENLWGGGVDLETKEIDYNSMINLRPRQNNPSRDIVSLNIRQGFDKVIKKLLL